MKSLLKGKFMREYSLRANALLIILLLIPFLVLAMGQSQKDSNDTKVTRVTKDKHLPVVDFDAEEPTTHSVRAKRRAKASRYDHNSSEIIQDAPWMSGDIVRKWTTHWDSGLSPLPIANSDAVIIGMVTEAQAHLSNDRTSIYSDFNVRVEEVLKNQENLSFPVGAVNSAERYGGAVRFRSGSILRYEVNGQGMPRVGGRYLLFLKRLDQEPNFSIVTGYDVTAQTVSPLDGSVVEEGTQLFPSDKYQGFDVSAFLELVRTEIAKTNNR